MNNRDTSLIGTFIDEEVSSVVLRDIVERFQVDRIFIFNLEEKNKFLLTFNVLNEEKDERLRDFKESYKNTIQLHRNKDNNTLFTINSLNRVVQEQTGGNSDPRHKVDWSDYKNSCVLLSNDKSLKVLKTTLSNIIEF